MKRFGRQEGFTLVEIIVVIAVIAILAAIMTPSIIKNIDDSKIARAKNDVQVLGAAIADFYKDTGKWPSDDDPSSGSSNYLYVLETSDGNTPGHSGTDTGGWVTWGATRRDTFENQLILNDPKGGGNPYPTSGEFRWKGPYINEIKSDPWGNKYYCNVIGLWKNGTGGYQATFVLSAGPDGVINTDVKQLISDSPTLGGDDIGFRVK
jgi:general secretion pathway protein G